MKTIRIDKQERAVSASKRAAREAATKRSRAPESAKRTAAAPVPDEPEAKPSERSSLRRTQRSKRGAERVDVALLLDRGRSTLSTLAVPEEWLFSLPELAAPPAWLSLQARPFDHAVPTRKPSQTLAPAVAPPLPPQPVVSLGCDEVVAVAPVETLWLQYAELRDIDTRNELVERYRGLVDREARRIASRLPRRVDTRDLETAGVVGLIDAIQHYDLARGVAFESYGRPRVRGAILDELRRLDWMPRMWRARRTRRIQAEDALRDQLGREPIERELADHLGLTLEEFQHRYGGPARGLEMAGEATTAWGDAGHPTGDRFEGLADPRSGEDESRMQVRELIDSLLEELDPDDRRVLLLRYFRGWTMGRIAELMRISESRVCRIHSGILERLKRRLESRRVELLA